ncbi:hypothetical protein KW794_02955 [Candidatus Saccharibacteria bacterium]|nr:hypothetical protein [Candidatus Saccharibacteria bacterium]
MSAPDMRVRRFYLSRDLNLREYNALKEVVQAHPAHDGISHSDSCRTITVKVKHNTDWAASGMNLFEQIKQRLDGFDNLTYEPSVEPTRLAA